MKKLNTTIAFLCLFLISYSFGQKDIGHDTIKTSKGDLVFYFVGHGTLYFTFSGKTIHIDPVSRYADYAQMPKADIILITHHHGDHLDSAAIKKIAKENTEIVFTQTCFNLSGLSGKIMKNGESAVINTVTIEAVPAYNLKHKRDNGDPFHPKGDGNGYVLTFGNTRVYIAGDTENVPEMANLKNIDIAFLPMNLPYTMTPEMVVSAVEMIKPRILYPYHYGNTNTEDLLKLMVDKTFCEVRIRELQ